VDGTLIEAWASHKSFPPAHFFFSEMRLRGPFFRVPGMRFFHINGLCRLGGLGDDSGCPTEAVKVPPLFVGASAVMACYVVKTDRTNLSPPSPICAVVIFGSSSRSICVTSRGPYFFKGAVERERAVRLSFVENNPRSCESPGFGCNLRAGSQRSRNGDLLFAQCDPGFPHRAPADRPAARSTTRHSSDVFARRPRPLGSS